MLRTGRIALIMAGMMVFALAIVARAAQVQLFQSDEWSRRAERQQVAVRSLPAPRGTIVDVTGTPLALSRESIRLEVAPHELRDPEDVARALREAGVPARFVTRTLDTTRRWVPLPGRYSIEAAGPLLGREGVYATPVSERVYPSADGVSILVGRASDGEGRSGIELAFDSVLTGTPGSAPMLRDSRLRRFESPRFTPTAPRSGNTVVLSIHHSVQDIVERALGDAVQATGASGGDVVVVNPHTGEVLALASLRRGRATMGVLTEPYEPGSTLKPLLAARLIELGRARMDDVVETPRGMITPPGFRSPVRDVRVADSHSLTEVLRYSSNVGMIKFADRMTPGEKYVALRDLGLGMDTGVPFPSEASGSLTHPRRWSTSSGASLAMGYGLSVTPLQLAMAYAAIANGGELLEPILAREVRTSEGDIIWRAERRVVRRAMSEESAAIMREALAGVVDSGTATAARLATYEVGGKSGTSRNAAGGSYVAGSYLATFVGLFPARDPQFVVLVKINEPRGTYYGGATAAPVSRAVIEAALAARDASLDRGGLVSSTIRTVAALPHNMPDDEFVATGGASVLVRAVQLEETGADLPAEDENRAGRVHHVPLAALDSIRMTAREIPLDPRPVPDVSGQPLRTAAFRLHQAGFRVRIVDGELGSTRPAAGSELAPGELVRLGRGQGR